MCYQLPKISVAMNVSIERGRDMFSKDPIRIVSSQYVSQLTRLLTKLPFIGRPIQ